VRRPTRPFGRLLRRSLFIIHPRGPYKPVEIEIYGQLAALLRISERAAADPLESRGVLVAGIGFEPMTFRL